MTDEIINEEIIEAETDNILTTRYVDPDHRNLEHRDANDQHPISAITGLQSSLDSKASVSTTYTKTEVDSALNLKADKSDTYTKTEIDTSLNLKADKSTTYTKTEVDNALNAKADKSTTYTKTEVDSALSAKADTSDIPTKTSDLTNDSGFITSSYHDNTKQDTLVSGTNIKTINNQSILGSGNIEIQGGSGNVDDVKVNGTSVVDSDKVANVTVPTKTSDLTNDSGYITSSYHDSTKQDVISDLSTIKSNASAGKSASDTISTYGNIVTHNTSEFATASQGSKADTAVQPTDLSTVATSGSYNDLSNKPTIPTVNDGTLTIQKNGTTIDTFTANSSTNTTINITVPTNNNELTNGAGYQTSANVDTKISSHNSSNSAHSDLFGAKQDTLVSGTNIKTVNNQSLLGSGNIEISGGSGNVDDVQINGTSIVENKIANIQAENVDEVELATVATTGNYNDLTNKPTIPTAISDLTDDTSTTPIDKADTLTGLTATVAELNYTVGVTSNIQTQINSKSTVSVSATGTATDEVNYITVNGVEKKLAGGGSAGVSSVNGFTGAVTLYTAGTTDLVEGVSELDAGKLYFVYEE